MAFVWNVLDPQSGAVAKSLGERVRSNFASGVRVLDEPGLFVYQTGTHSGASKNHVLAARGGVVLGTLFTASADDRDVPLRATPDEAQSAAIVTTHGRALFKHYWGRYVAIVRDAREQCTRILRDPTGGLPCLLTSYQGVFILFSNMQDCLCLGVSRFSVNWRYISAMVPNWGLQLRETGLNEVSEILPGESIEIRPEGVRRVLAWHPVHLAQSDGIEDPEQASIALRNVTRRCVQAWASCYGAIVHRLSGGLDSSIVLACLDSAPSRPAVVCLNYFYEGTQEDERSFARLAVRGTRFELVEQKHDPSDVRLDQILGISRSSRPGFYLYHVEHSRYEAQLAQDNKAGALFSGMGGDALFYQARGDLAAADYVRLHGVRSPLMRIALGAARMERLAFWTVMRRAFTAGLCGVRWNPFLEAGSQRCLINPELIQAVRRDETLVHPWIAEGASLPPGKFWHLISISMPLPFYDPLGRADDPENVYPLMSQPLIELCLRLPTYVLTDQGWDRATARRAFGNELPQEIVRRRTKGASTQTLKPVFDRNIGFIRELLLDGLMVKERLLDRVRLEECLAPNHSPVGSAVAEILIEHICTEAWLRRWQSTTAPRQEPHHVLRS